MIELGLDPDVTPRSGAGKASTPEDDAPPKRDASKDTEE